MEQMAVFFSVARSRMSAPRREFPALAAPRQANRTSKAVKFISLSTDLNFVSELDFDQWYSHCHSGPRRALFEVVR
jgi:hypothetical protein